MSENAPAEVAETKADPAAELFEQNKFISLEEWDLFQKLKSGFDQLVGSKDVEIAAARQAHAETEQRAQRSALTAALATALASGPPLVPGAASQLVTLWADRFVVKPDDANGYQVTTGDGKALADFVREQLKSDQWLHFVKADARGGAGGGGDKPNASGGSHNQRPRPGSLEDVAGRYKAAMGQHGGNSKLFNR